MLGTFRRWFVAGQTRKPVRKNNRVRRSWLSLEHLETRRNLSTIIIDDFNQAQSLTALGAPPQTAAGFVNNASLLGGQRDAVITKSSGTAALKADFSVLGGAGIGYYSNDFGVDGSLQLAWDGADNNAANVAKTGLGGLNFAQNTTGFDVVASSDLGANLKITVYSGATGNSIGSVTQALAGDPAGNFTTLRFNYSAFAGVDFTQVGAITLDITPASPSADTTLQIICASGTPQADIAVTKTVDTANPKQGQPFNFTVTAKNLGPNLATNVSVNEALPAGLTINSITPAAGTSYAAGVWTVGDLALNASSTLIVNATIPLNSGTESFTNTATLAHVDQGGDNPGNNTGASTVTVARDFGDAQTVGQTTGGSAARHALQVAPTLYLGSVAPDAENNGQPNAAATGDNNNGANDEEGFNPAAATMLPGQSVTLNVNATGSGLLDAFIDFDHSGTFDPSERITPGAGLAVNTGANSITFTVPNAALTGNTNARFRVSTAGGLAATGFAANGEVEDYQVAISSLASVGDRVFVDANANGIQDGGEAGLDGVTVELLDAGNTIIGSKVTAAGGTYNFPNLLPGTYSVHVVLPGGYQFSALNQGGNGSLDSDVAPSTGLSAPFTLTSGQNDTTRDAGVYQLASVGDKVFQDLNDNGIQDVGDNGLDGVVVHLHDGSGAVVATKTTAGGGLYNFPNLTPGTYSIDFVLPGGFAFSPQNQGGNATLDSDANSATGRTANFNLVSGQNDLTRDAGVFSGATVGDFVFLDINGNGVQDAGDNGVNNATVCLFTSTGTLVQSKTTNGTGAYQFTGIIPGSYYLQFDLSTVSAGAKLTTRGATGSKDLTDSDPDATTGITEVFALAAGEVDNSWDAGMFAVTSVSGQVFLDANANGGRDGGETGIAGVTVALSGTNDLGQPVGQSTTTNSGGNYAFNNLRPGTYMLTETQPAAYNDGQETIGSANGTKINDKFSNINLAAGVAATDYLFGELGANITGTVFADLDRNTAINGSDYGIGGVTLKLTDTGNNLIGTTITAADGTYKFGNLPTGNYTITETQPAGYGSTTPNVCPVTVPLAGVANKNFGESLSTIAGTVFVDTNNDGNQAVTEKGIAGVTVQLAGTNAANQAVNLSTATAADGTYKFSGLLSGTYTITELQPNAYIDGKDKIGSLNGTLGNDVLAAIVVGTGVDGKSYCFGELIGSSLTGKVFVDTNKNGKFDGTEKGLAGVVMVLTGTDDRGAHVTQTMITDKNGIYTFATLRPGTYQVNRAHQTGYTTTKNTAGNVGGLVTLDAINNFKLSFNQLGVNYLFGLVNTSGACKTP